MKLLDDRKLEDINGGLGFFVGRSRPLVVFRSNHNHSGAFGSNFWPWDP